MTTAQIIEVAVGLALVGLAVWLYRRPAGEDGRSDTQGAVLLLVIAALLLIHGLGLMDYRPTAGELGR